MRLENKQLLQNFNGCLTPMVGTSLSNTIGMRLENKQLLQNFNFYLTPLDGGDLTQQHNRNAP